MSHTHIDNRNKTNQDTQNTSNNKDTQHKHIIATTTIINNYKTHPRTHTTQTQYKHNNTIYTTNKTTTCKQTQQTHTHDITQIKPNTFTHHANANNHTNNIFNHERSTDHQQHANTTEQTIYKS